MAGVSHNHIELFKRINKFNTINLAKEHNEFIQLLTNFYKHNRYGRYSLKKLDIYDEEKNKLVEFINKYSDEQIANDFKTPITQNNIKIKFFIGSIIKKIVLSLYAIIKDESAKQNIYTSEIRLDSKVSKIFLREEFDFQNEAIFTKEILIYMLQSESGYTDYIKSIEALEFDEVLLLRYFKCINNDLEKLKYFDELESLYESIPNFKIV